jgi:hypothetical protein
VKLDASHGVAARGADGADLCCANRSASAAAHDPEQYQEDDGAKRRRDEVGSGRYREDAEPRQDEAPMSAPRGC